MKYNTCSLESGENIPCSPGINAPKKVTFNEETKEVKDDLGNILGYGKLLENGHLEISPFGVPDDKPKYKL